MKTKMLYRTDDLRIREIKELLPPDVIRNEFPLTEKASEIAYTARQEIHRILHGADDRLLVIIGPCSIHDTKAALEYAARARSFLGAQPHRDELEALTYAVVDRAG